MDATTVFVVGAVMILAMGWGVVGYMRRPLKRVLLEVCGNEGHAQFWSEFSTVGLGLVTAVFAVSGRPDPRPTEPAMFALADQLKSGLLGLTGAGCCWGASWRGLVGRGTADKQMGSRLSESIVITGAFSYTGKYATRLLLDAGYQVRTLTGHPERCQRPLLASSQGNGEPGTERVAAFPYNFERPDQLRRSLEGASTLINTYWVRFPRGSVNFETAVRNSRVLIQAARDAGVKRIVHVSIANPSLESPLAYYRGKAQVEAAVRETGMSYAIVRPTVIFGAEDILINNIAWFVRNLPVFGIPGDGQYGVRPIYVEDMARLLVSSVAEAGNSVRDAVGPETFRFEELVRMIAREVGSSCRIVHMPVWLAYLGTIVTGWMMRDVVLTWEEYLGLMANLLAPDGPEAGSTRLSEWLAANRLSVGRAYASEVGRHFAAR